MLINGIVLDREVTFKLLEKALCPCKVAQVVVIRTRVGIFPKTQIIVFDLPSGKCFAP